MPDKYSRQESISSLHPAIRKSVADILKTLHSEGLNFEVFEAWRSPHLQQRYYSRGRNRLGKIVDRSKVVTYAKPWRSFHQYGLAVDLVLKNGRKWSWNDRGTNAKKWERMHEVAREHGMVPLKFEKPHIQIASISKSSELYSGKYPAGADAKWARKLGDEIASWSGTPAAPPVPNLGIERPPVDEIPGGEQRQHPDVLPTLTGQQAYRQIIDKIFEVEGGYVNHPNDPGSPTNMGITLATLRRWRGLPCTARDVRNLSKREAAEIYKRNYFDKVNAAIMPACLALHVFNTAVLSGPYRSGKIVQKALNALGHRVEVDGIIGPQTMKAILSVDELSLADEHYKTYLLYLRRLSHWPKFGKGWTNRMNKIHTLAEELARAQPAPTQTIETTNIPPEAVSVYLFKGLLGDIFSTGLGRLADLLETEGCFVKASNWYLQKAVYNEILRKHHLETLGKLVLVGHSLGANAALKLASRLQEAGVPVHYVATLDPTISRYVDAAIQADNFRSSDVRDKPVPGANEIIRNDLNHIQIDKDRQVHQRILSICKELSNETKPNGEENNMPDNPEIRSGAGGISSMNTVGPELKALIEALVARLEPRESGEKSDDKKSEVEEVIRLLSGRTVGFIDEKQMTPINAILGSGIIGQFLNGRKTAIGIFGLLGTYILPVLFPQAAPVLAALKGLGLEQIASNPEAGTKILTGVFSAFAAWGGLGKLEKWFTNLSNYQR